MFKYLFNATVPIKNVLLGLAGQSQKLNPKNPNFTAYKTL